MYMYMYVCMYIVCTCMYMYVQCMYVYTRVGRVVMPQKIFNPPPRFSRLDTLCPTLLLFVNIALVGGFLGFFLLRAFYLLVCYTHIFPCIVCVHSKYIPCTCALCFCRIIFRKLTSPKSAMSTSPIRTLTRPRSRMPLLQLRASADGLLPSTNMKSQ